MPRSGTTLIEQILAAHPNVFAAGEIGDLDAAIQALRASDKIAAHYPELAAELSPDQWRRLGADYLRRIRALAPAAERITNKMPANFAVLGLIRLALPNAQIIHVRRDPLDTCFSCFSQIFDKGAVPYAYDLAELGRFYRAYDALMAHWRAVAAGRGDARSALRGCRRRPRRTGAPHRRLLRSRMGRALPRLPERDRPVRTASVAEVRQPIYATSIGRWRAYEPFLGPLRDALGPSATAEG